MWNRWSRHGKHLQLHRSVTQVLALASAWPRALGLWQMPTIPGPGREKTGKKESAGSSTFQSSPQAWAKPACLNPHPVLSITVKFLNFFGSSGGGIFGWSYWNRDIGILNVSVEGVKPFHGWSFWGWCAHVGSFFYSFHPWLSSFYTFLFISPIFPHIFYPTLVVFFFHFSSLMPSFSSFPSFLPSFVLVHIFFLSPLSVSSFLFIFLFLIPLLGGLFLWVDVFVNFVGFWWGLFVCLVWCGFYSVF